MACSELEVVSMNLDVHPLPVVQPGTAEFGIFKVKSQRFNQVQETAGIRA